MQTKLTLRLDDALIEQAKVVAQQSGKSVSQLVAEYFSLLAAKPPPKPEITPSVQRLRGVLKPSSDERDYQNYLEDKYR